MNFSQKLCLVVWIALVLSGCYNTKQELLKLLNSKIVFGDYLTRIDSLPNHSFNDALISSYKILIVFKQNECVPCNLLANNPTDLVDRAKTVAGINLPVIFVLEHTSTNEVAVIAENYSDFIIFQDKERRFCLENNIPDDSRSRFLLLDSINNVALVGNPISNPKFMDLYMKCICNSSEIEIKETDETQNASFVIHNQGQESIYIDTVFTSCDCTVASIDKMVIQPDDSARLKVNYKADKPGPYMREVYVKTVDSTYIFTIRGETIN